jgi:hypothetical protein
MKIPETESRAAGWGIGAMRSKIGVGLDRTIAVLNEEIIQYLP